MSQLKVTIVVSIAKEYDNVLQRHHLYTYEFFFSFARLDVLTNGYTKRQTQVGRKKEKKRQVLRLLCLFFIVHSTADLTESTAAELFELSSSSVVSQERY